MYTYVYVLCTKDPMPFRLDVLHNVTLTNIFQNFWPYEELRVPSSYFIHEHRFHIFTTITTFDSTVSSSAVAVSVLA
jgi:hypothetical protein